MAAELKIEFPVARRVDVCGVSKSGWKEAVWNAIELALCPGCCLAGLQAFRHSLTYRAGKPEYRITVRFTLIPGRRKGMKPALSPLLALAPNRSALAYTLN